jgi:hypothetical protein
MTSAGVVMNDGEYCVFDKIEYLGQNGLNYLRKDIQLPVQTTISDSTSLKLGKRQRTALPFTATLVSDSFNFDPAASASFVPQPLFSFNADTLIVHDYWALSEQPLFNCSLSVSKDTLSISYLPRAGGVNDWTPTVETVLKIKLGGAYIGIICCFNAVTKHTRPPRPAEVGFRDAGKTRYATITAPPLCAYKYRAHSYPAAMVYLHYQGKGKQYQWISPCITVTLDSATSSIDWAHRPSLSGILSDELQWLAAKGVCAPSSETISRTALLSGSGNSNNYGLLYWTKQDSTIGIKEWFEIVKGDTLTVLGPRCGNECGLESEFELPPKGLASAVAASPHIVPSGSSWYAVTAIAQNNMLTVASSTSFDKMAVYNLLGREMYSIHFSASTKKASVPLVKTGRVPGNYIIFVGSSDRTMCRPIVFQH